VVSAGERVEAPSFGGGLLVAFAVNCVVAVSTIPIANHWNARGGEEWSVGLVLGSAALTGLVGIGAAIDGRRRRWAVGVLAGAVFAPTVVGAVFIWYFAILHGS